MNQHNNKSSPLASMRRLLLLALSGLVVIGLGACSMDESVGYDGYEPNDGQPLELRDAELALADHRIDDARKLYADYLERYPEHGGAAAGLAITNLLLLLDLEEVEQLLTENLGASGGLDANELLYAEGGYLYWASRGARWEDDGEYRGIRSLLEEDLPWPSERLATLSDFVEGLDEPMDKAIVQLVWIANALAPIDLHLEIAIDDPAFQRFYVPGEVFHSSELSLQLGRSELSTLRSLLALTRAVIYFVAAYEHEWTLEMAFGSWRDDPDLTHPYYEAGFEPVDYTISYLDDHLLRGIANPDRLSAARSALRKSLEQGRQAITYGLEEQSSTTLRWQNLDESHAQELDDFLAALHAAFDGPTDLPHMTPSTTLDLRPLFTEGRVLDEEIPWMIHEVEFTIANDGEGDEDDSLEGWDRWSLNDEALFAFWFDGIVDPVPDDLSIDPEMGPEQNPDNYVDVLFGHYWDRVENVYFTTR